MTDAFSAAHCAALAARRAAVAQQAALRAAAGAAPGPLLGRLRRLTTAELLAAPPTAPGAPLELGGLLGGLCAAAQQAARCPPGWLRCTLPAQPVPVYVTPRLAQAAVLAVLRGALCAGQGARLCLQLRPGAALLWLGGGPRPGAAPALLGRLAAQAGGCALYTATAPFAAALRLPLAGAGAAKTARPAEELLADRYSLLYQFLAGHCAGPD